MYWDRIQPVFLIGPMAHQMIHKDALWPGAMIRLGPQWCKVKWAGIVTIVNMVVMETGGYKAY